MFLYLPGADASAMQSVIRQALGVIELKDISMVGQLWNKSSKDLCMTGIGKHTESQNSRVVLYRPQD